MNLKPEEILNRFVFVTGRIAAPQTYILLAHDEALLNKDVYHAHILRCTKGQWEQLGEFRWQAVDLCVPPSPKGSVLVLGRDGQVALLHESGTREEKLDPKRPVGPLRGVQVMSSVVYAYGMKREIFRRTEDGKWQWFNKGMIAALPKGKVDVKALLQQRMKDIGGINSLECSKSTLYAFGMRGEIWRLSGDVWIRIESPTNVMLADSVSVGDANIFVCGQTGTILKGAGDRWQIVEYAGPGKLDFCSIAAFKDRIYLADGHSLRQLDGDALKLVNFGTEDTVACSSINCDHGELLSVAGKEVFATADGKRWIPIITAA